MAGPSKYGIPNGYGQNQQKVRRSLTPTPAAPPLRPLSERLKDPLLQKTIDEGGIPERAPIPPTPSDNEIIKPRPRIFVNPFEGEELLSPPKTMPPGRVNVAARPDQNFATNFSPRPLGGSPAAPSGLPTPPPSPGRLSQRLAAPTAGPSPVAPPESPTSIPSAGPGLNTTQVAPPRGPGYVNMATAGNVDRAPGAEPKIGGRIPMPGTAANPVNVNALTPEAQRMTSRLNLDPAGMGGAFANFANSLAERQGQPRVSDRFRLPTNQEATLAGGAPNVTASSNFGAPRPMPGDAPVVQRFKQPEAPPQFVNADGKAMLNDPATLDDRVAAARQRLSERLAARATPPAPAAEPAAPPAVPAPPVAAAPPAPPAPVSTPAAPPSPILQSTPEVQQQPLFSGGRSTPLASRFAPPTPAAPPVIDPNKPYDPNNSAPANPNKPTETTPVSLPVPASAAPEFTRFTPPAAPGMPAVNVKGPVTSPEDVAANKARRAEVLNKRQEKVEARGAARGEARTQRLEARKRGPSLVDQLAARNPAFAAEVMRQQGAQALADKEFGFRGKQADADRAQRGELAGKDFELKGRTLSEAERANQAREEFARSSFSEEGRRLSDRFKSEERRTQMQTEPEKLKVQYAQAGALREQARIARENNNEAEAAQLETKAKELEGTAPGQSPSPQPPAEGSLTAKLAPLPSKAAEQAEKAGLDLGSVKSLAKTYGGLPPDPGGKFAVGEPGGRGVRNRPMSLGSVLKGVIGEFQGLAGGAGDHPDRLAAMLVDNLTLMHGKGQASFKMSAPAIRSALETEMNPEFRAYVQGPEFAKQHPQSAAYFKELLQGRAPSDEQRQAVLKELNGRYWWMRRAQ